MVPILLVPSWEKYRSDDEHRTSKSAAVTALSNRCQIGLRQGEFQDERLTSTEAGAGFFSNIIQHPVLTLSAIELFFVVGEGVGWSLVHTGSSFAPSTKTSGIYSPVHPSTPDLLPEVFHASALGNGSLSSFKLCNFILAFITCYAVTSGR